MRVDVSTLGTFNELATRGADSAADALAAMGGAETAVRVTRADLVPLGDVPRRFDDGEDFVGASLSFRGGMEGTILLVFDHRGAARLLDRILPAHWSDDESLNRSAVSEAANIMVGGFVDAWADHFGTRLQLEPPRYVAGTGTDVLPSDAPTWDDRKTVLTFSSQLTTPDGADDSGAAAPDDEPIDYHIYMFPERSSFAAVVGEAIPDQEFPISIEKLSAFTEMTKQGAGRAAEKIGGMTGIDVSVEVGRTTFVPVESVPLHASPEHRIGAVAALQSAPGGYVVILFDRESAVTVGDALLPVESDGTGLTDQHRSAIEEIGNIMTSGFIDGWANATGRTMRHDPPELVEDTGEATLARLVERVDAREHAFLLDATVRAAGQSMTCDLYAVPDERSFREVLGEMSMREARAAAGDPEHLEPAAYEDLR